LNTLEFVFILFKMEAFGQFRPVTYDKSDTEYATTMKQTFHCHPLETQAKFNEISQNLMEDAQINRYGLLNAIEAYMASPYSQSHPLNGNFKDNAYNVRPEQCCIS
jgi:hypothetical protein